MGRFLTVLTIVALWAGHGISRAEEPASAPADTTAQGLELFTQHVRTTLVHHCARCHGGEETESEFNLLDREGLLKGGKSGPVVVPGDHAASLLYRLVSHAEEPHMPHDGEKLSDELIEQLAAWIDLGAPYDKPLEYVAEEAPGWISKVVPDDARQFWSFQPLAHLEPPAVADAAWCRTPIDRFILARLEAAGLAPNPAVDRRQLIRRACFDLTGLPPTPEEVDAFVNDPATDAYDRLLDRLLASPHYGERWARHWLDVARFAESHGFEHDYDRPTAYHYRDFVIQALNAGLPYDTFIKWQLAGDEYEPENNLALMATGFLAAGVHSTQITKNEVEKHRYDEMDDMLATVGTSMLGLTIGCARCHDHKFDAIPQRDYYRLLSTFTTTVRSEVELDLHPEEYAQAKAAFDLEHAPFAAALERFEREELPSRLAAWEASRSADAGGEQWVVLTADSLTSAGGATFTRLDDGSYLAGGTNAQFDTYSFAAKPELASITAVRIEALADASLVKGGPGRADNGNFALTDCSLAVAAPSGGDAVDVPLQNPRATFEQAGLPVAAVIDDNETSCWAVDPEFGKDHAAAFECQTPAGLEGGSVLTFTLVFKNNDKHSIGRLRISVTTAAGPLELQGSGVPAKVVALLGKSADERTTDEQLALAAWYRTIDPEWRKLNQTAQEHLQKAPQPSLVKALISTEGLAPLRLHSQGEDFLAETHFLRRGDPNQKLAPAPQGFLQVLMPSADVETRWQSPPPAGSRSSYRRRALAEWITDVDQGAGRLLARVIVNRLWQYHLGHGIVSTPSDFGTRGTPPTHPELLDWLATELIRGGWQLKPLHKLIMRSAVYQERSQYDEAKAAIDLDNRLFWRRPPRRLEAEVIRDSILSVSGTLDATLLGPGTLDPASKRRSIYFTVKRSQILPMMQVFDAPDALQGIAERPTTTIAPQALLLMNNPHVRDAARGFARRIAPDAGMTVEQVVELGYRVALARQPTPEEQADCLAFIAGQLASYQSAGRADAFDLALADFCQTLLCLNEFVYID